MPAAAATPCPVLDFSVTMYWPGTTWPVTDATWTYELACAGTATTPSATVSGATAANASRVLLIRYPSIAYSYDPERPRVTLAPSHTGVNRGRSTYLVYSW